MLASKVTTKYQATIPEKIRKFLHLQKGDNVAFQVEGGKVLLQRIQKADYEYLKSLSDRMIEWSTEEDEEAYRTL